VYRLVDPQRSFKTKNWQKASFFVLVVRTAPHAGHLMFRHTCATPLPTGREVRCRSAAAHLILISNKAHTVHPFYCLSSILPVPSPLAQPSCPMLFTASIMPASAPFLPAAATPSRACARAASHVRLRSAAACKPDGSHRLLPAAVALMVMVAMNAAFGVARAQGTWSTAELSVARYQLAAASVGNVALFAGGYEGIRSGAL
jgi:hypothetical protein